MWNAFAATRCFGLGQDVAIVPETRPVLAHSGNVLACNKSRGLFTEAPQRNNRGATERWRFLMGCL